MITIILVHQWLGIYIPGDAKIVESTYKQRCFRSVVGKVLETVASQFNLTFGWRHFLVSHNGDLKFSSVKHELCNCAGVLISNHINYLLQT